MDGQLAAPLHFAVEFLILAVCAGAAFDALRGIRDGAGRAAWMQASGFAALVVAQIVHGAFVVDGDGELPIVVLRTIGFGLLALSLRPMPAAGMPALFVAGTDARWAALPALFALATAGRAFAARRRDGEAPTLVLGGAFTLFAAGDLVLAGAGPDGGAALAISHAARAAGAILLARWLWLSIVRSVRLRFVAVFVAALVLLVTVVASALTQVIGRNLETEELRRLQVVAVGQQSALESRQNQSFLVASTLADLFKSDYRRALTRGTARALFEQGRVLLPPNADLLAFLDANGRVVESAREVQGAPRPTYPPLSQVEQIALAGSDVVRQALGSRPLGAGDLISLELTKIAAVGAAPVQGPGRQLLGAIVVGFDLDPELLLQLQIGGEADITILKGGEISGTTFLDPRDAAGLIAGSLRARVRSTVEEQGRTLQTTSSPGGERSFTVYVPITSHDGTKVVGVLAVSRPAVLLAAAQRTINRTLFLITLAASAIAAALAWLLSGRVTKPIRALTRAARQVRGGDLDARATVELPDEVGTLGAAFNDMAASLKRMTDDLRSAADEEANLRAQMEAIMQSMGDALVATHMDGTVVAFNRSAEQMLGRTAEATVGRTLGEVLTGTDAAGRPLAEAALGENSFSTAATVDSADGRRVPVVLTGGPLRDAAGSTVGRVIVFRDVTREHEAERMKSEFLANVSHELRTPLTPIKGYTEILRRKQFPRRKTQTFLDGIMDSTKRLERIVEILVDFAALEAGRLKPRLEPVDLRSFLTRVVAAWRDRKPDHRFVLKVPRDLPAVLGDERMLRKSLDELIDNAVKFSPDGGDVEVVADSVSVARRSRPSAVRVMIRDRGIGIEEAHIGRLFQDFRQLDGSETRTFGGLGLGLSYARRLIVAHHGDITAASEAGRGSTFTVTLPVAPAAMQPRRVQGRGTQGRAPAKPGARPGSTVLRKKVAAAKIPPPRKGRRR